MSVKQAELMMLFVTFSWSSSYLLMKIALTGVDPFTLMLLRFSIAFLCVLPLLLRTLKFCTINGCIFRNNGRCVGTDFGSHLDT